MRLQINKDRSVELSELTEKDAVIWASSVFLNKPYPDNYDELLSQEPLMSRDSLENSLGKYIIDNERHEYPELYDIFPPSACAELINRTASLLQQSLKDSEPKPKKYNVYITVNYRSDVEADSEEHARELAEFENWEDNFISASFDVEEREE